MNYRGKDKLAEALMNGLLKEPVKKEAAPIVVDTSTVAKPLVERQSHSDTRNLVAISLKPNKPEWAKKLEESNTHESAYDIDQDRMGHYTLTHKKSGKSVYFQGDEATDFGRTMNRFKTNKVAQHHIDHHLSQYDDHLKEAKKVNTKKTDVNIFENLKPEIQTGRKFMKEGSSLVASILANRGKKLFKESKKETLEEKVARLDEISKKTLGSYIEKAAKNHGEHRFDEPLEQYGSKERLEAKRKAKQRLAGISKATKRLVKEEHLTEQRTIEQFSVGDVVGVDSRFSMKIGLPTSTGHVKVVPAGKGNILYVTFGHGEHAKNVPLSLDNITSHVRKK